MTLHTLFSTSRRAALLRRLDDSRTISASLGVFDAVLADLAQSRSAPRIEADETDTAYTFTMELPGFKRDQVGVEVQDEGYLSVRAARAGKVVTGSTQPIHTTNRTITLPTDADPTKVEAKLEDGILSIVVSKVTKPTPPAPRKVTVS